MDADYSFYVKTIETHARAFFKVIIFSIGIVSGDMGEVGVKCFSKNYDVIYGRYLMSKVVMRFAYLTHSRVQFITDFNPSILAFSFLYDEP